MNIDIKTYLDRIGAKAPETPSLSALEELTRAHLIAVPFENLTPFRDHQDPSLEPEDLFHKIVTEKRGGYCFELNKLFYLLLCQLGFDCTPVAARVINGRPEPCPLSHRATIVRISGKRYFCDVGFGGRGPKGILCMDTPEVQTVANEKFILQPEGDTFLITNLEGQEPFPILRFQDEGWLDVDFQVLSRYYASYSASPFRNKRILYRCTADGWISLVGNVFTENRSGCTTAKELSEAQISQVISKHFDLKLL